MPTASAINQPIGIDHQIPTTPITRDKTYASTTLIPKEITVSTTDILGLFIAL